MKGNTTIEGKTAKEVSKIYPYLNCKQTSPRKRKELM
jgi:hypothetical protein